MKRVFGKNLPSEHILALSLISGTRSAGGHHHCLTCILFGSGFLLIQVTHVLSMKPTPVEWCYLKLFDLADYFRAFTQVIWYLPSTNHLILTNLATEVNEAVLEQN